MNATNAATANNKPGHEGATSRPRSTGSAVRPQPPCSSGIATERQAARGRAGAKVESLAVLMARLGAVA